MFQSYFESIKYVGHLLPVAFLRIYLGYFYLNYAVVGWKNYMKGIGGYSSLFIEALGKPELVGWYRLLLSEHIIPNWKIAAFILIGLNLAVGVSYLLGYIVRPMSIIAMILSLNLLVLNPIDQEMFYKMMIVCHFVLAWVGAGRCIGLDYYFFKRKRGIWW